MPPAAMKQSPIVSTLKRPCSAHNLSSCAKKRSSMLLTFTACNACVVRQQPEAHQPTDTEQARAAVGLGQGARARREEGQEAHRKGPAQHSEPADVAARGCEAADVQALLEVGPQKTNAAAEAALVRQAGGEA